MLRRPCIALPSIGLLHRSCPATDPCAAAVAPLRAAAAAPLAPHLGKVRVHRGAIEGGDIDPVEAGLHPEVRLAHHLVVQDLVGEGRDMDAPELLQGCTGGLEGSGADRQKAAGGV